MTFYNPAPFAFSDLPLYDWRDESRSAFVANSPQSELGIGQGQAHLPGIGAASARSPIRFWSQQVGVIDYRQTVNGVHLYGLPRTVANVNLQTSLKIPLVFRPGLDLVPLISPGAKRRRYLFECCIRRGALEAGSILMAGLTARQNGTLTLLPNDATNTQSIFAFRSLLAENAGRWSVAFRNGFGPGALTIVDTGLASTVFTAFLFDFTEDTDGGGGAGGTLRLYAAQGAQGGYQLFGSFTSANFPVLGAADIPSWIPQVGSEGALGANTDQVIRGSGRFRVFEAA